MNKTHYKIHYNYFDDITRRPYGKILDNENRMDMEIKISSKEYLSYNMHENF